MLKLRRGVAIVLVVAVAMHTFACNRRPRVRISRVDFRDDGVNVVAHVQVTNGTLDPVYVYLESLETTYDSKTQRLTLGMHVVPAPPGGTTSDCHVHVPAYDKVPAMGTDDIDVLLPRIRTRVITGTTPPIVERDPLYDAKTVRVELGWSRKPLELPPLSLRGKCRFEVDGELRALEEGIATGAWP